MAIGKFKVSTDIITYSIVSVTEEQASFPKENIPTFLNQMKTFRTNTTTLNQQVIDLGTTYSNVKMFVFNTNFSGLGIEANPTNDFGSPSFSTSIAVGSFLESQRRQGFFDFGASFSGCQYIRLTEFTQSADNGDSFFKIGGITFVSTVTELLRNPDSFSMSVEKYDKISREGDTGIQLERANIAPNRVVMSAGFLVSDDPSDSLKQTIYNVMYHVDWFLLYFNRDYSQEAFIVESTGIIDSEFQQESPTDQRVTGLIFEEVLF